MATIPRLSAQGRPAAGARTVACMNQRRLSAENNSTHTKNKPWHPMLVARYCKSGGDIATMPADSKKLKSEAIHIRHSTNTHLKQHIHIICSEQLRMRWTSINNKQLHRWKSQYIYNKQYHIYIYIYA